MIDWIMLLKNSIGPVIFFLSILLVACNPTASPTALPTETQTAIPESATRDILGIQASC